MTIEEKYAIEVYHSRSRVAWIKSLGFDPYPWQCGILKSPSKRKSILGTRQAGKSTIVAGIPTHRAKYYPKSLSIILAPTQDQARDDMEKVKSYIASDPTYPPLIRSSQEEVMLSTGSKIQVVTASDTAARGKSSPDVIVLDEDSRIDDIVYTSAVRPMLTNNAKCEVVEISTPNGKKGHFYSAQMSMDGRWEKYFVRSPWRVAPGNRDLILCKESAEELMALKLKEGYVGAWYSPRHYDYKEQLDNLLEMGAQQYRQEYECDFVEADDSVFRYSDINALFDSLEAESMRDPFDIPEVAL